MSANSFGRLDSSSRSSVFGRRRSRLPVTLVVALVALAAVIWAVPHLPFVGHHGTATQTSADGKWVTKTLTVNPDATAADNTSAQPINEQPKVASASPTASSAETSNSSGVESIPVKVVRTPASPPAHSSSEAFSQVGATQNPVTTGKASAKPNAKAATTGSSTTSAPKLVGVAAKTGGTSTASSKLAGAASNMQADAANPAAPQPLQSMADKAATPSKITEAMLQWHTYHVHKGETLSGLFSRANVPAKVWIHLLKLGKPVDTLKRLSVNHSVKMGMGPSGHLLALNYQIDATHTLKVSRKSADAAWQSDVHQATVTTLINRVSAVVHHSLLAAAHRAGLTYRQATQFADIFRWQVNLRRDIRPGDRIIAIYNQRQIKGKALAPGRIVAAKLVTDQHTWQAFWFHPKHGPSGYFNAHGHSLKAGILRAPIHYVYISSKFSLHRFDPYLHKWQPHYGVDYAADVGTPIEAAANGRIIFRGRQRGYGRVVIIKSFGRWRTYYAHMHRFAKGLHVGSHVRQGEVIGYVGESGWATGPHLHFGIRKGNHWVNPLKAKLPTAHSVPARYRHKFERRVHELLADIKAPKGKLGIAQHRSHTHSVSDSG